VYLLRDSVQNCHRVAVDALAQARLAVAILKRVENAASMKNEGSGASDSMKAEHDSGASDSMKNAVKDDHTAMKSDVKDDHAALKDEHDIVPSTGDTSMAAVRGEADGAEEDDGASTANGVSTDDDADKDEHDRWAVEARAVLDAVQDQHGWWPSTDDDNKRCRFDSTGMRAPQQWAIGARAMSASGA
jgi:hypothetical protein